MSTSKTKLFAAILLFWLSTVSAKAAVWENRNNWSEQQEQAYSAWFQKEVTTEWLKKPDNIFNGWSVDCAKFVYLQRLYFAWKNNLEFAVNSEAGTISSRSSQWDSISDPQERVKAFARFILSRVNTSTLPRDTVLVPLQAETLRPGLILLGDSKRRHAWMLQSMRPSGIPILIFATLPASNFLYESFAYPAHETAFPLGQNPSENGAGLRRFRWPSDLTKKHADISYASLEQTKTLPRNIFEQSEFKSRLAPLTPQQKFSYLLDDLCMKLRVRVNIIIDAAHAKEKAPNKRLRPNEEDLYSTYARDADILKTFDRVDEAFSKSRPFLAAEQIHFYESLLTPKWNEADFCWVGWADDRSEPAGYLREKFKGGLISSDANHSFAQRWGE